MTSLQTFSAVLPMDSTPPSQLIMHGTRVSSPGPATEQ
jgi:hypothetical protein